MPGQQRRPNRERADMLKFQKDVIDAGHKSELDLSRLQGKKNVAYIVAAAVPLLLIWLIFRSIVGQKTEFSLNVTISFTLSVAFGAGWANERRRTKSQRTDLKRARERLKELESTVEAMRDGLEEP